MSPPLWRGLLTLLSISGLLTWLCVKNTHGVQSKWQWFEIWLHLTSDMHLGKWTSLNPSSFFFELWVKNTKATSLSLGFYQVFMQGKSSSTLSPHWPLILTWLILQVITYTVSEKEASLHMKKVGNTFNWAPHLGPPKMLLSSICRLI